MKLTSLEAIIRALNDAQVRYLIAGGLAVVAHGYGRVTFDVDLVIQLQEDNIRRAIKALSSLGYRPLVPVSAEEFADPAKRRVWIEDKGMVVFQLHSDQHQTTRIDLFVKEPFDFDQEYDRALTGDILPDLPTRFVSLQTLLHMKIAAGREKDKEDIRQLRRCCKIQMKMTHRSRPVQTQDDAWAQHNLSQLRYFRSLDLRTKLEAVEGMADVVRRFQRIRAEGGFRVTPRE